MRSFFLKSLLLSSVAAVSANALSLYDTAPAVGMPQSHAIKYHVNGKFGYDTNVDSKASGNEDASLYVNAGFGATFADFESVDKISYNFNLGATRYLSGSTDREMYSDCHLSASITHALTARSTYSANLNVSYSPEPDYANGISASHWQGDCLNWGFSNSYSQSLDSRLSWNMSASYSGNFYSESEYQNDDRQYLNASFGYTYRASELLSYNASVSYRYDMRNKGYDSNNLTISAGFSRSLDPVSSFTGRIGLQTKQVHNDTILSPNFNLGYNRRLAEGLSINSYLTLSNENVDTYRGVGMNYLSDMTWRLGFSANYTLSPDVSFSFGISVMRAQYTKGTGYLDDETNTTINPSIGMSYRFTEQLTGNINYQYTLYDTDRSGRDGYTRHNISGGLSYNF